MQENGAAWRGLSEAQRRSWNSYASENQRQLESLRKKPSVEPFTGYRLFTMLYCQRRKLGMEPLLGPPHSSPQTDPVELALQAVGEDGTVEVEVRHQHGVLENEGQPTHFVQVAMTPPTRRRSRRPRRKHAVPVCTAYGQGLTKLPSSGSTLQLKPATWRLGSSTRFGLLVRVVRSADGMPGPWTWCDSSNMEKVADPPLSLAPGFIPVTE